MRPSPTLRPNHDTPLGALHPYWARKPLNIVSDLVATLSEENDTVIDPFMGSMTIPFASAALKRFAIGADLSELSMFIATATTQLLEDGGRLLDAIDEILAEHSLETHEAFILDGGPDTIERIHYMVEGEFSDGNFSLIPAEIITKVFDSGRWRHRRSKAADSSFKIELPTNRGVDIVQFEHVILEENSRIAIPPGARLSHYFSPENQWSINSYLRIARSHPAWPTYAESLLLPLSAALPMFRLSDRKASSQWPFWRPKRNLTSRNPMMVLKQKRDAVRKFLEWCEINHFNSGMAQRLFLHHSPVQSLGSKLGNSKADLVLTDPPYADQVPYLEYTQLWAPILGFNYQRGSRNDELVVSTGPRLRTSSTASYESKLSECLQACLALCGEDGTVAWFYQDHILANWATIYSATHDFGFQILDVIPVPKQRRSLKTVTSPKRTLDGDLIIVFSRSASAKNAEKLSAFKARIAPPRRDINHFFVYASFVREALITGKIIEMSRRFRTVEEALEDLG